MMQGERLPIKFFHRREADSLRQEGGGGNDPPKWVLGEKELVARSQSLIHSLEGLKANISKKEEKKSLIPLVITAEIIEEAIAKSHRTEVSRLFRVSGRDNIIGLADVGEIMVKVESAGEIDAIIKKLYNIHGYERALSAVRSIEGFSPAVTKSGQAENYKVRLIDYQDYEQNAAIRHYFEVAVKEAGIEVRKTHYSPEHVIFNLKSVGLDSLEHIQKMDAFESVFSIEPMPRYRVTLDMLPDATEIEVKQPEEDQKYAVVGILDSGIAALPHLEPWVVNRWSPYPSTLIDEGHGTFVSGIVIYGDTLEGHDWTGINGVKLLDACVFPDPQKENVSEDELVANIQEVVNLYKNDVKVWNLSISVQVPIDETDFSDFAVALDAIQDKHNILICKSAGNCSNFISGHPKGRLHQGADSVRSIVVGSIAHKKSAGDLADVDNPSPFTRVGRGPSYIIKPEVVHFGGNAGVDRGRASLTGVKSLGLDGRMHQAVGTSHATPRVAALAAGLYQEMGEEFDPILIKALLIHSATYSERLLLPPTERVNQVGFGRPKKVRKILYNTPHEVTLIMRDEIAKGEKIDIHEFPMPECLISNGYYHGQIVVTLVYDPILEASQRGEYCQSDIDVKMGTFDRKRKRDTTSPNILNAVGREGSQNVLLESFYSKKKIKDSSTRFALTERLLIQYADKYYPVKKYAVDLSETTDSTRDKFLTEDKKWYLVMNGLFRDFIEVKSEREGSSLSQEFCLVVTIKDPTNTKPVYDQVTQKLDEYNFLHSNIKLRGEIRLEP